MVHLKDTLTSVCSNISTQTSDFDLNDGILPKNRNLKDAAVLIAVCNWFSEPHVLLTKRAAHLKAHPGQIAFPGGKKDQSDNSLQETALREAFEEVGLSPQNVEVLGILPKHETVTSFSVTPILGWVEKPWDIISDPNEVSEVFFSPISRVLSATEFSIESRNWQGRQRRYFVVPDGPYYIWGASARILRALSDQVVLNAD